MTERRLYDIFLEMFPMFKDHIMNYGHSTDGHELRVTLDNHDILMFIYHGEGDWKLETMKSYVGWVGLQDKMNEMKKRIKEAKKNGVNA